ncbi:quinate permease [Scheffersomyces coipomensis]|uniref:quinate permease n=1 Tax=Scheffersomyces coipomensis TaxID=1788519 RepID=UPI00315C51FB
MSETKQNHLIALTSSSSSTEAKVTIPPKSKFKWRVVDDHSPKEIYNFTLYFSVVIFGLFCGLSRGLDEGQSINLYQPSFRNLFGLNDPNKTEHEIADLKSNINSMVQMGSIAGAIIAMYVVDKIGRVLALREFCIIWATGAIIQMTSKSLGQLYAGRFIEGLAIGQSTTIGPSYMAEVAPPLRRGLFGCMFSGAVYMGILLSYAANYGTAKNISGTSNTQWMIPISLKVILATLAFIGSFFCHESPRWLFKHGHDEKAMINLCKIRHLSPDHPYILSEVSDISEQIATERAATEGVSIFNKFKDLVTVKSIRYRFFVIGCLSQILGQWSGANSITIYAGDLFSFIGLKGLEVMKMTMILGVVKLCGAYFGAFFVIDFLGRRRALYIGITLQLVSLLYFAIFLQVDPHAIEKGAILSTSQENAGKAAMAAIYLSGVGWVLGFNSIQYLLGSEIFPLKHRSFCQSLIMVLHFANQYGNSKAVPSMLIGLKKYGTFYFFVGVCVCSLLWCWFFVPEVTGRSLESMEDVFNLPWYLIGRRGAELCPDHSALNRIMHSDEIEGGLDDIEKSHQHYIEDAGVSRDDSSEEKVNNKP